MSIIKTIHIFPYLPTESISEDIKGAWLSAYGGEKVITWTYEKCKDFVQDKYPEYYYEHLNEYFEHDDKEDDSEGDSEDDEAGDDGAEDKRIEFKGSEKDCVLIITRFLVAFYEGGIIVSTLIKPEFITNYLADYPQDIRIFHDKKNNYNTSGNAMIDVIYAPTVGDDFWLTVIDEIIERKTTIFSDERNGNEYSIYNYNSTRSIDITDSDISNLVKFSDIALVESIVKDDLSKDVSVVN